MIQELIVAIFPVAGITTTAAYFIGKNKGHTTGYRYAIAEARAEAQADLEEMIGMRDYEDHMKVEQGIMPESNHVCGQHCRNMMKLRVQSARMKANPPKYDW